MSRIVSAGSEGARATVVSVLLDIYESTLIINIREGVLILHGVSPGAATAMVVLKRQQLHSSAGQIPPRLAT